MSKFINLTPHKLNVHTPTGVVDIEPSGDVARCRVTSTPDGEVGGIPVSLFSFGEVSGLPEPTTGVFFIVSGMVASHPTVAGRRDVFAPGALVRDQEGRPIGCKGLKRA